MLNLTVRTEKKRAVAVFILFLGVPFSQSSAEEAKSAADPAKTTAPYTKSEGWGRQRLAELQSPWTTPAKSWLIYGASATLALAILKDQIVDPVQEDFVEHPPLSKTASDIGDYGGQMITNTLYVLGMGLHSWRTHDQTSATRAEIMLKSSLYSVGMSGVLKYVVHEPRPDNTAQHRTYDSFPSGHTTAAFAFSSTVIAQHGFWPWGIVATALAVLTAVSRVNDNRHYLHDVAGGFTIGTAYGLGISYFYKGEFNTGNAQTSSWNVLPVYSEDIKGLFVVYEF